MHSNQQAPTPSDISENAGSAEPRPPRADTPTWRVALTGASGLIGSAVLSALASDGHHVSRLVRSRRATGADRIFWDPATRLLDARHLEGFDAIVHLAGEPVAKRWTDVQKRKIRRSRVEGTRLLSEAIALLSRPPKTLVSASAVGFYGDRGDAMLDETSSPGTDFLAEVARE